MTGPRGETGPQGPEGEEGPQGRTGQQGVAGPRGDTGVQGPTGPTGRLGTTGPRGQTGAQGPTGAAGPQGPTGLLGESLAQTITLLTGGKIRTSDEHTRMDADGFWLRTVDNNANQPTNRVNFYTGTWTNKQQVAAIAALTDAEFNEYVLNIGASLFDTSVPCNSRTLFYSNADNSYTSTLDLLAENERSDKSARLRLHSYSTGSNAQISAEKILLTDAFVDMQKAKFLTGSPATGYVRLAVRATGAGNAQEQLVVAFKNGAPYVLAHEGVGTLPCKLWIGRFVQGGEDDPYSTTLYNSLGVSLSWSRTDVGTYQATTGLTLTSSKCMFIPESIAFINDSDQHIQLRAGVESNKIVITALDVASLEPTEANLTNVPLMLCVFP
jgi:hypothetical protein